MQIWGSVLQLVGAIVTAAGLLYAWNRASGKLEAWRRGVRAVFTGLRAQVARRRDDPPDVSFELSLTADLEMTAEVDLTRTGTIEERLNRAENEIATLPGQISKKVGAAIDGQEAAIAGKLAELDAIGKAFAVKDISVALAGVTITAVGVLLVLVDMLC